MKIYCSQPNPSLSDFAGQNVWVLCKDERDVEIYVRVAYCDSDGILSINSLPKIQMDDVKSHAKTPMCLSQECYRVYDSDYQVVYPLDLVNTRSVYNPVNNQETLAMFNKIAGKDFWVEVKYRKLFLPNRIAERNYIKIRRISADVIYYTVISYYSNLRYTHGAIDDMLANPQMREYAFVDLFMVKSPLEILTTEELYEFLTEER